MKNFSFLFLISLLGFLSCKKSNDILNPISFLKKQLHILIEL